MKIRFRLLAALCVTALGLSACGTQEAEIATFESTVSETQSAPAETATTASETQASTDSGESSKILVACFSATGNTKPIAETAAQLLGADFFEIVPEEPYTDADLNYSDDSCRANREQDDTSARPAIAGTVENMDEYDIVLLGHPIWWGEEPRIMDTFMESYDFSGKTVVNFCTSGGSGISSATENLKALSPNANWLEGHRFVAGADADTVQEWLDSLGISNA